MPEWTLAHQLRSGYTFLYENDIRVDLDDRLISWLREQSTEAGMSLEELAGEILRRQVTAERFLALTNRIGQKASKRGLTQDELDELVIKEGGGPAEEHEHL